MSNTDIDNQAPNQGAQAGQIHSVTIINPPPQAPHPSALNPRDRTELLRRLVLRYQARLESSLAHQVRLELGMYTRPDAVDPTWRRMLFSEPPGSRPIPQTTPLLDIFDSQQGQLLVLGAPGAGKTTLMVELALALTKRAQADVQARIPVLLNVASWRNDHSMRAWLAHTLPDAVGTSRDMAAQLADSDDLLLLLDGLDEVAEAHREACVQAINTYLQERHLSPPLAMSCRSHEHTNLDVQLQIAGAVELEPLNLAAVEQALVDIPAAQGAISMLQNDPFLRDLANVPLIVNILLLAYADRSGSQITAQTDIDRRNERSLLPLPPHPAARLPGRPERRGAGAAGVGLRDAEWRTIGKAAPFAPPRARHPSGHDAPAGPWQTFPIVCDLQGRLTAIRSQVASSFLAGRGSSPFVLRPPSGPQASVVGPSSLVVPPEI